MEFRESLFCGLLLKGELRDAISYLGQFPEQQELYRQYVSVFENGAYPACEIDDDLNDLLRVYQKYYREVFYLGIDPEQAAEAMESRFMSLFGLQTAAGLGELEDNQIAGAFRGRSYQFLGGKTGGYFGPYIWRTTETETYAVELPDGIQEYTVRFLDGFLSKSWLDFISFGRLGRESGELAARSIEEVRAVARELFAASAALCRDDPAKTQYIQRILVNKR